MSDTLPPPLDPPGHVEPRLFDFPQSGSPPPATLSLDTAEVSATQALYQAAIGPVNTDRYLPLFTRFEAADRVVPSWNWAASLCTLGWMLFRRMGMAALVYLALAAALLLAAGVLVVLVFRGAPELQWGVGLATALLLFLVPGILGDTWLHAHTRMRMARALADSTSWTDAAVLLGRQAVGWPRAGWVALGHAALLVGVAAVWLAVPGVRQYLAPGSTGGHQSEGSVPRAAASVPVVSGPVSATAVAASGAGAAPVLAQAPPAPSSMAAESQTAASAVQALAAGPAASAIAPSAVAPASAPAPASATAPRPAAPSPAVRPLLNVGLFAVESNARAALARLRAAGLPATLEELQTRNGTRFRVRAGPFASPAAAEAAARRIRALGLEAQRVKPPAASGR